MATKYGKCEFDEMVFGRNIGGLAPHLVSSHGALPRVSRAGGLSEVERSGEWNLWAPWLSETGGSRLGSWS